MNRERATPLKKTRNRERAIKLKKEKSMKEETRKELRAMVRTMYDYQDMRLRTAGRLRLKADDTCMDENNMDDAEISEKDYSTVEYVKLATSKIEKRLAKEIESMIKEEEVYSEFFKKVRGCGPLMSAACLAEFDIQKADTVSKMWQFAGVNPGMVKGKKIIKITKTTDMSQVIREYENMKGEKCGIIISSEMIRGDKRTPGFVAPYNSWLRIKLCGVLAGNMIKAQHGESGLNYAINYYYPYKMRLEQEESEVMHIGKMTAWKDVSKGHRDASAKRYMIKMFLKDLYAAWREIEGLPVRAPYKEEYLGHKHSE
jgi:hypothetical protein